MALATTTASGAITQSATSLVVASATSIAAGRLLKIDDEFMQVSQGYSTGTTVPVVRGQNGTVQKAHVTGANVVHGDAADFTLPPAQTSPALSFQWSRRIVSISATGTLTLPKMGEDLVVVLNGTTVITLTIPVPTNDLDGSQLTIVSNGIAAHVLTFTGGLSGAGASYDVITLNAARPVAVSVIACNGLWFAPISPPISGVVTNLTGTIG
jgi:hypothetical protein